MPEPTIAFPFFRVPIFSLALTVGLALSIGIGLRRSGTRPAALIDACLGGMAGGLIGARAAHVLLNWTYFAENVDEALRLNAGGLDWHGAVIGGLVGLTLAARLQQLDTRALLDALAPALPVLAFAGWMGCWAAVCGYGAEVDTLAHYPAFAAAETRDVYGIIAPRYNTQIFGIALAAALLAVSVALARGGWLKGRRFWALLALLSAAMFGIGFLRGDYAVMVAGIRADQWIDVAFVLWGAVLTLYNRR